MSFAALLALGRLRRPGARLTCRSCLSVGVFQLTCFFALSNLGAAPHPGRAARRCWPITTSLWLVPLAALAGGAHRPPPHRRARWSGSAGLVVLVNPLSLAWTPAVLLGHAYLLLAGARLGARHLPRAAPCLASVAARGRCPGRC